MISYSKNTNKQKIFSKILKKDIKNGNRPENYKNNSNP